MPALFEYLDKISTLSKHILLPLVIAVCCQFPIVATARAQTPVELELVLAIDTSTSVDKREFELQRHGLANAFLHPAVVNAIRTIGPDGIAVSVVHWAGPGHQQIAVGWMLVKNQRDAARLAAKIRSAPRRIAGFTDIAGAINFSMVAIENGPYQGRRRVIDVSGDGTGEPGPTAAARNLAVARGLTINGLVIFNEEYDLGELATIDLRTHYATHVIGGDGAFMMEIDGFEDFPKAIRRKLIREILGPNIARHGESERRG